MLAARLGAVGLLAVSKIGRFLLAQYANVLRIILRDSVFGVPESIYPGVPKIHCITVRRRYELELPRMFTQITPIGIQKCYRRD